MPGKRNPSEAEEAADMLQRVIDAVDAGEISSSSARDVGLKRRLEGALIGLRSVERSRGKHPPDTRPTPDGQE
jgi:hypothetical protein